MYGTAPLNRVFSLKCHNSAEVQKACFKENGAPRAPVGLGGVGKKNTAVPGARALTRDRLGLGKAEEAEAL